MTCDLAIIFTGHMVDLPDRATGKRRFPAAMEPLAREAITQRLRQIASQRKNLLAISAAARGGDILFLEGCRELAIPYLIALPFAPERFVDTSVKGAVGGWEERYWRLWRETQPEHRLVMPEVSPGQDPYSRHNLWLIELARERAPTTNLIALWDGAGGDGPGGTADLVARVTWEGGKMIRIDSRQLLRELDRQEGHHDAPNP